MNYPSEDEEQYQTYDGRTGIQVTTGVYNQNNESNDEEEFDESEEESMDKTIDNKSSPPSFFYGNSIKTEDDNDDDDDISRDTNSKKRKSTNNSVSSKSTVSKKSKKQVTKATSNKKKKKGPIVATAGTPAVKVLVLPFRAIKRVMKIDTDVGTVQNEAAILVTYASELFLKKFAQESHAFARKKGRNTIRYEDVAEARVGNDPYAFLQPMLP